MCGARLFVELEADERQNDSTLEADSFLLEADERQSNKEGWNTTSSEQTREPATNKDLKQTETQSQTSLEAAKGRAFSSRCAPP